MSNRFGLKMEGDHDPQPRTLPSQWPDNSSPLLLGQCTPPTPPTQVYVPTQQEPTQVSVLSQQSTVTPESSQIKVGNYTAKKGSMTYSYYKRKERERKATRVTRKSKETKFSHASNSNKIPSNQITMTQIFPSYSELRRQKEYERQLEYIQTRPDPFDPRDEIPDKALTDITRFTEEESFKIFLKKEKKKAVELQQLPRTTKGTREKQELKEGSTFCCEGCGQLAGNCHNIKYGRYCVDVVRGYYYTNKELDIETQETVARKLFFDHYNYALHYDEFRAGRTSLGIVAWDYTPRCLEKFSYDDVMGWFVWKSGGGWVDKKDDKMPSSWSRY